MDGEKRAEESFHREGLQGCPVLLAEGRMMLFWHLVLVESLSCVRLFAAPMDCSTPGFPVLHCLPEFAQTHAIQPSHPLSLPSPPALNLSQHQSFPVSHLFASGGQSIGVSASASVFPMNIQGSFPLGLSV